MKHFTRLAGIGLLALVSACACNEQPNASAARAQECRELGLSPGSETFKTCMETPVSTQETNELQQLRNTVRPRALGGI